jgi:hypothetical protein
MVQVLLVLPVWALDPLGLVEFLLSIGDLLGFQLLGRVHLVPVRVFLCRCYMLQMPVVYAVQRPTVRPVLNAAGRDFPILIREVRNLHQSAVLHDDYRLLQLKLCVRRTYHLRAAFNWKTPVGRPRIFFYTSPVRGRPVRLRRRPPCRQARRPRYLYTRDGAHGGLGVLRSGELGWPTAHARRSTCRSRRRAPGSPGNVSMLARLVPASWLTD